MPNPLTKLRYLRVSLFQKLLAPVSSASRERRMQAFLDAMEPSAHARILDLGGQPQIWAHVDVPLDITILNLPGIASPVESSHHTFTYVEGDACDVTDYGDQTFDIVYSNSVIEHVGPETKQREFASEVARLAPSYWIQTPSKWFPIEAHCGMPFWWFYPESLRRWFIDRWKKKLPAWSEMVEETRYLERRFFLALFPGARLYQETVLGIPKSYSVWSKRV